MNKKEMLKQASGQLTDLLYIDNKPKEEINKPIAPTPEKKEVVKKKTEPEKEPLKMLSYRVPESLFNNIDKYAYVKRQTKQDVLIMIIEKFFNTKENKSVLEEYDNIKG